MLIIYIIGVRGASSRDGEWVGVGGSRLRPVGNSPPDLRSN